MKKVPDAFTNLLAAWNERNLVQIRTHLDKCLAENVVFADPANFIHGKDAFTEMIRHFRQKYPEAYFLRTSGIDSHNNRYRYNWEMRIGETTFIKGTDFAQLDENGLVERVDGFFGDLPLLES